MLDPHDPQVEGISEVLHDDRPDSAHEAELREASGDSSKEDDKDEDE